MDFLEKFQTFIILFTVIIGLILGQIKIIASNSAYFIVPFLFLMLFGVFLGIPMKDFKNSFLNFKFAKISLVINFLWTPLFAYVLGSIFLSQHIEIWIGFLMLLVTPCTDWYLIFTEISKGNVPLSASILPLNLILQLILLPIYLIIFVGATGIFDIGILFESIFLIVLLPFFLAQITKLILNKWILIEKKIINFFNSAQVIFLSLAIFCMFASQGKYLIDNLWVLLIVLIPILLFFIINFIICRIISKYTKLSYETSASLCLTILARNSPISLAIAVVAFTNQPLVSLTLVIGPLIELPILTIVSQLLLFIREKDKNYI